MAFGLPGLDDRDIRVFGDDIPLVMSDNDAWNGYLVKKTHERQVLRDLFNLATVVQTKDNDLLPLLEPLFQLLLECLAIRRQDQDLLVRMVMLFKAPPELLHLVGLVVARQNHETKSILESLVHKVACPLRLAHLGRSVKNTNPIGRRKKRLEIHFFLLEIACNQE